MCHILFLLPFVALLLFFLLPSGQAIFLSIPPGVRVHPTPIYETVQSLIVFGILWSLRKKGYPDGAILWLYLILAGSMRFLVEFWRVNPVIALGMTEYQWMSLMLVLLGGYLLYRKRISGSERAA